MALILVRQLHLPAPRAAGREDVGVAQAVALVHEQRLGAAANSASSSTSAPGLSSPRVLEVGELGQLAPTTLALASSFASSRVIADVRPAGVSMAFAGSRTKLGPSSSGSCAGSTSATLVGPQPPSARPRRPPSISRLPPRRLTNSRIMSCCSGVSAAASKLPIISAS